MKIVSVELVNFSRVYSGLGKTKVTIDLLNNDNQINLFVGENGTGKTSIMSCCHPFAYNNAIGDSTSNSDLIISGKDGKKTVVITYGEDVYRIQHVYTRKKDDTISVKSYIMENNEELNDSGTVSTFKTIIYEKLGINEVFLTLLSIGNRVNGFVEYTAGERKKFASKIFQELGIFNEYYKRITVKARKMKTLLSNVTSKLSKYKDYDLTTLELQLKDVESNLSALNEKRLSITQDIGGIENQLKSLSDISDRYDELQKMTAEIMERIDKAKSSKHSSMGKKELEDTKEHLLSKKMELDVTSAELSTKITGNLNMIDKLKNSIMEDEDALSKLDTLKDERELESMRYSITSEIDELSKYDFSIVDEYTKEYLIRAEIYLLQATDICSKLIFDTTEEDNIINLFDKFKSDNKLFDSLEKRYQDITNKIQTQLSIASSSIQFELPRIDKCRHDCEKLDSCPYASFYHTVLDMMNKSTDMISKEVRTLQEHASNYENDLKILSVFREVTKYLLSNKENLRVPMSVFDPNTFIHTFVDCRKIYNQTTMAELIDLVEKRDRMNELQKDLDVVTMKISRYNDTKALYDMHTARLESNRKELKDIEETNVRLISDNRNITCELESLGFEIDNVNEDIKYQIEIEDLMGSLSNIHKEVDSIRDNISKIENLKNLLHDKESMRLTTDNQIRELEIQKQRFIIIINDLRTLQQEELTIREDYDDILAIQEAVSPTKGIPVEFIEYYMKNQMIDKMNDLLDSVYHGGLVLLKDKMVIDDKEFKIPYKRRNTIVEDISNASDGERAILTITFSLVLIQLSLDKYNIMLLDEIDTSLDYNTRGKFLDLIERYMTIIGAKQLFLISHNNMFDTYPINVIMTSEQNISNMKMANVIKLYE